MHINFVLNYFISRVMVDKETFQEHFWWCLDRFREAASEDIGVPGYFRFMTLLGACFKFI